MFYCFQAIAHLFALFPILRAFRNFAPTKNYKMEVLIVICIVIVSVLVTAVSVYLYLRRQKDALRDEVKHLKLRLTEMESEREAWQNDGNVETADLSEMNDAELFAYISTVIKDEELFRRPEFNRTAAMERFALSAARIGGVFMRGGGMSLPEFVRNCRLDYACRLMVEQPELSFTEVGEAAGFQRTTTFYHDFKARFGMPPADYRKEKLAAAAAANASEPHSDRIE